MPSTGIYQFIQDLLAQVLGYPPPPWVLTTLAIFILVGLVILGVQLVMRALKWFWSEIIQPTFYNPNDKRRRFKRQMFADHVEAEVRRLNALEAWNDNRFTELEAEVEAEGQEKILGFMTLGFGREPGLRREKSLSRAIERSNERLILWEGEPGSGKSVALRHVAQVMAEKARKSRSLKTRIPIYINLKYLQREQEINLDRDFIESFIFRTINRVNDRDIEEYLHEEFRLGLQEGTWFFLFDSFDEIPEILSSTGSDDVIRQYAEALRDFLHGMNRCKGIVASREYKGPRFLGWPKFRILALNSLRISELIVRTRLPLPTQKAISDGLLLASHDFKAMASNPMFLNLVCEFMNKKDTPAFPRHIHSVFEEYVRKRLNRDEARVRQRFNKTPNEIKEAAERIAFCMTADRNLGLGPSLDQLKLSMKKFGLSLDENFETFSNALEYLKLARIDSSTVDGSKTFTFVHRRFQEYFATEIVLQAPDKVNIGDLLTNGRWRETCVVILQTREDDLAKSVLDHAFSALKTFEQEMEEGFTTFRFPRVYDLDTLIPKFRFGKLVRLLFEPMDKSRRSIRNYLHLVDSQVKRRSSRSLRQPMKWPQGLFHVLSILQSSGITYKPTLVSENLKKTIDHYLFYFSEKGDIIDRKNCLEVVGVASPALMSYLVKRGLEAGSRMIRSISFQQISKLGEIPKDILMWLRIMLLLSVLRDNSLFVNRREINAQFAKFSDAQKYLNIARVFEWTPLLSQLTVFLGLFFLYQSSTSQVFLISMVAAGSCLLLKWHCDFVWRALGIEDYDIAIFAWVGISIIWIIICGAYTIPQSEFALGALIFVALSCWDIVALFFATLTGVTHPIFWTLYLLPTLLVPGVSYLITTPGLLASKAVRLYIAGSSLLIYFISLMDFLYIVSRWKILREYPGGMKTYAKIIEYIPRGDPNIVAWILMTLLFPTFASFLIWSVVFIPPNPSPADRAPGWLLLVLLFMFGILAMAILIAISLFISFVARLMKSIFSWKVESARDITALELIATIEKEKISIIRNWILKDAFKRGLIGKTLENQSHLRNLIAFVNALLEYENRDLHYKTLKHLDPALEKIIVKPWQSSRNPRLKKRRKSDFGKLGNWDSQQLDSLCNLLEQVQEAQFGIGITSDAH